MKRFASAAAIAGVVLAGAVATAPTAFAGDRTCRGTLGSGTVNGNVRVPAGATCTLRLTKVKGNVIVAKNGTLRSYSARVDGNIQGTYYRHVIARSTYVDGNIQLTSGGGLVLTKNVVDGDIQVFSNKRGLKDIYDNRVDGNLQCKSNVPAPKGARNKVKGNKEGQCRRF